MFNHRKTNKSCEQDSQSQNFIELWSFSYYFGLLKIYTYTKIYKKFMCTYVHMYTCVHAVHMCTYVHIYVHMYTYMYMCTYVHVYTYVHMKTYVYIMYT